MLDFFGFSDIFMGALELGNKLLYVSQISLSALLSDRQHHLTQMGTQLLFYGLYYGVMGRDFAEV